MMEVTAMATTTTTPKSPDPESETPIRIQPAKPISFSNGTLKRHPTHHHHHNHHHPVAVVTYKECLKNHAASLGGHALDGCGEFMPSPSSSPSDPTSLKCAACGCHRNFHRRDGDDPSSSPTVIEFQPHHRHHPPPPPPPPTLPLSRSPNSSSPPPISSSYMLLALSNNNNSHNIPFSDLGFKNNGVPSSHHHHTQNSGGSRKRFRTKFSQYQKERMQEFAERLGWKMQKRDDDLVRDFCRDIGVDRGVLKVWMHNNKNNFSRKDPFSSASTAAAAVGIGERRSENDVLDSTVEDTVAIGDSFRAHNGAIGGREGRDGNQHNHRNQQHNGGGGGFDSDSAAHGGNTNGSSSSS